MNPSSAKKHTIFIKEQAKSLGFDFCGISKVQRLDEEANHLTDWLSKGYHGQMAYMENHLEKRVNPSELVPGARSVVSLMYNYYPGKDIYQPAKYRVARYAYGNDYHKVIKEKLASLYEELVHEVGEVSGRIFVDSAPVMERQWAARSGLGWLGKNTLLINKQIGSYFFLAEIILDLDLEYDGPVRDFCGSCSRCIDACPTDAILPGRVLEASKCISYLTIELKETIPEEFRGKYQDWVFGCDICQEVCPWNRFANPHREPQFNMNEGVEQLMDGRLNDITDEIFSRMFRDSPLKRTKLQGLKRNMAFLNPCNQDKERAV